jgi:hypothetical protein
MQVDGDCRTAAGVGGALLLAYSRKPQGGGALGGGGAGGFSLSQSLSQNRDAAAGGKGRPSAEEYAREVREAYDAIEEPVDAIREVGAPARERSFFCAREVCHTAGRARVPVRLCLCVSVLLACVFICMHMRVCGCLRVRDGWMTSDFLLCLGTLVLQPPDVARLCPQIGEHHLQQLFGAMLLATKGPERQGERDDLLVTLGMVTDSATASCSRAHDTTAQESR